METDPLVSVVTVTYQSEEFIGPCLESVFAHAEVPFEIIVVDNASTDATLERAITADPQALLLALPANRGFAAATNVGAAHASGPYLLLLNPDAQLLPGALPALVEYLEANSGAASAGPRLAYGDGTPQDAAFSYPTLLMGWLEFFPHPARLLHTRWNGRLDARDDRPVEIDHPLGACMLVRRSAWDDVGPMDEGFFMYCEEVDWCMRAKARGWSIVQVPTATAIHHGGKSAEKSPVSLLYLYESRRRLHRKFRGPIYRVLSALITRLGLHRERQRLRERRAAASGLDPLADERIAAIDRVLKPLASPFGRGRPSARRGSRTGEGGS